MTKYIKHTAVALLAALSFTSCSDDNENNSDSNLTVTLTEVGHGGAVPHVHAGDELHLEAEILAEARIASVKLEIHNEADASAPEITAVYTDYNNLINATFHKHVLIPPTQPAGLYHLHLTVTDLDGNSTTAETELEILAADTESGITISLSELGEGPVGSSHVASGTELHIEGSIVSAHPVASVSVEIHKVNAPEIEVEFANYVGQTTIDLHEHIQIPASQPDGQYHFHLTVVDDEGHLETIEYELTIQ